MEPKTKLQTSPEEAGRIRRAVQNVRKIDGGNGSSRLVEPRHAGEILELLKDERVSGDVYTLPRPFSITSITDWIEDHQAQARAGTGLLLYARHEDGKIMSITDFQFWPKWSACEFGGVIAHTHQNQSLGTVGVKAMCDFAFETIGVQLIALTTSLDNVRSQKS
ncbi:MAG: GNAT family N-acetyltransferase [Robiginitomaculum sp.]|nr:GNAT family N-acetyltransferase [Robiginitomaculum sp.]